MVYKKRMVINWRLFLILAIGLFAVSCGDIGGKGADWFREFDAGPIPSVVKVDEAGNLWVAWNPYNVNRGVRFVGKYDNEGNELWTRQFGSREGSVLRDIEIDGAGNFYMVGGIDCSGSTDAECDEIVGKYDSEGNELWTHQLVGHTSSVFTAVAVDDSGVVYVVGGTPGTLPGQTNFGGGDAFVRKLDGDGDELWTRQFGSTSSDWASSVAISSSASIYVAGRTNGVLPGANILEAEKEDVFVRKYDADGNELWTRQISYSSGIGAPSNIEADSSGNIFIVVPIGGNSATMYKFGNDGEVLWARSIRVSAHTIRAISVDVLGNVYVVGFTRKASVRKLDPDGDELWFQQFGTGDSSSAQDAVIDGSGNVYVVGSSTHRSTLGPETSTTKGFLAKLKVPEATTAKSTLSPNTFPVGNFPNALVFDGESIWVATFNGITKLSLDGQQLGTFSVGDFPRALAFDGESIWVANAVSDTVTKLGLDGRQLGTFPVGDLPEALAFDGKNIWVANSWHNSVTKLGLDGREVSTFPVGQGLGSLDLAFDGESIWVADGYHDEVTKLGLDGHKLATFPEIFGPRAILFDGKNIWVANGGMHSEGNKVTKLGINGEQLGTFKVGDAPVALAFDGESIWVANSKSNTVTKLSLEGRKLGTFRVGDGPSALAFDGESIWVANAGDDTVSRLELLED